MSEETAKVNRAISGDIAELSQVLTGIDLRMVRDVEPLLILNRLRKYAKPRDKTKVLDLLDETEKEIRARQYLLFSSGLREDISKLGIAYGHTIIEKGLPGDII